MVRHGRVEVNTAREAVALQSAEEPDDAADVQPESVQVFSSGALFKARQHVFRGLLVSETQGGMDACSGNEN